MVTITKEEKSVKKKPDSLPFKKFPEIFTELDFEKNKLLGLDVYSINYGSPNVVWWCCPKCKSSYDMTPNKRTSRKSSCPFCSGYRVNSTNSLGVKNSELSKEWHPIKNGDLTPFEVYFKGAKKYWWKCQEGHEWEASMEKRQVRHQGCPTCSNQRFLIGFNDMWTTNPELASLLADPNDGYKYLQTGIQKVDWKCSGCKLIIKSKAIKDINRGGLSCPRCSSKFPYGERFMYTLLFYLGLDFKKEKIFKWAKDKRYDFYIKEFNMIIEVHGIQHTNGAFKSLNGNSLEEEIENDIIKEDLAKANGIEKYIVIDAAKSSKKYLESSVLKSELPEILTFDSTFLEELNIIESNHLCIASWKMWNDKKSINEIADTLKVSRATVRSYLIRGSEVGKCSYTVSKSRTISLQKRTEKASKRVVKLSLEGKYLNEYSSIAEAARDNNFNHCSGISACCNRKRNKSGGFKWMFKKVYNEKIEVKLG